MTKLYQALGLSKRYGVKDALLDVNFTVQAGRLVGLPGPRGSGTTALLTSSAGLLRPPAGDVLILRETPGIATKSVTAYLPDRLALPVEFRVCDAVALYSNFFADFDKAKANAMLADLKLEPLQRIGAMSKGTQEKMQLCLTMSRQAKLYLLDEPLGGVDPAAREYIMNTILRNYSEDAAVVISTHLIDDIEKVLDEVLVLKEGRLLLQSGVDELREERGQSLDEFFRDTFRC